jgi:hypothetical protein
MQLILVCRKKRVTSHKGEVEFGGCKEEANNFVLAKINVLEIGGLRYVH